MAPDALPYLPSAAAWCRLTTWWHAHAGCLAAYWALPWHAHRPRKDQP